MKADKAPVEGCETVGRIYSSQNVCTFAHYMANISIQLEIDNPPPHSFEFFLTVVIKTHLTLQLTN